MKSLKSLLIVLFFPILIQAQNQAVVPDSSKTILEKGTYQVRLKMARQIFFSGEYRAALNSYRELLAENEKDALLNLRIGECYLALEEYSRAIEHIEIAKKLNSLVDKELPFILGQAYHRYGRFDLAIDEFEDFITNAKDKKDPYKDAVRYISQCKNAKDFMANPVKADIMNLGHAINSPYDDYAPSITANGETMIFTSRRSETTGGMMDVNDGKFYEDIYISKWDYEKKKWGSAASIAGKLNTEFHDANLSISPDGTQIFVYKNIPNETRSGDIYVSKLNSSGNWSQPKPISPNINSSYFESSASLSADGKYLYFVSERKGGHGQGDIYRSEKLSSTEWSLPVNLGPVINSSEDEISVFIHPDGKTLYFSSNSSKSMGGLDIFKSVFENDTWSEPVNLGYPINTLGDDLHFVISADNNKAYYSSIRPGGLGERDIYSISMSSLIGASKGENSSEKGLSIIKGQVKMLKSGQPIEIEIEFYEPNNTEKVGSTMSDTTGNYFITLPGGKEYDITLNVKGCKSIKERVNLPFEEVGTHVLIKSFLLENTEE